MSEDKRTAYFQLFSEISILEQLSRAILEARLPPGMRVPHFSVLSHITRVKDGLTPLELARAFQVAKTTMTHTLAGLESSGLVEMRPNAADARSKQVWITSQGRSFRDDAIAAVQPDLDDLALEFPGDRVARILPELEELRRIMDRRRDRQ